VFLQCICLLFFSAAPIIDSEAKYKDVQKAKLGSTVIIPVTVTGFPIPKVSWFKGEKELKSSNGTTVETQDGASKLSMKGATADTSGTYVVKAENAHGSAQAEFTIDVKGTVHIYCLLFVNLFIIHLLYYYINLLIIYKLTYYYINLLYYIVNLTNNYLSSILLVKWLFVCLVNSLNHIPKQI